MTSRPVEQPDREVYCDDLINVTEEEIKEIMQREEESTTMITYVCEDVTHDELELFRVPILEDFDSFPKLNWFTKLIEQSPSDSNSNNTTNIHCNIRIQQSNIDDNIGEEEENTIIKTFKAPSPDSVLDPITTSSSSSPSSYPYKDHQLFSTDIPRRARTKRGHPQPIINALSIHEFKFIQKLMKKAKKTGRKCMHCGIESSPQWRAGPMGPTTLCNACGVRYKSGRLFPEYRPAASPSFVPWVHSNSHKKVVQMRKRAGWAHGVCIALAPPKVNECLDVYA
ncbi:GATA transcription factor 8 [Acorus gramineus]|uniref:GATA transcription factor 8 n=1 Tax=Acorus gramineus TaxID=55184 RepID=A0AAV9AQE5_ACOGR|nr:GATA transcription factor 8 [Acorus gramineus]